MADDISRETPPLRLDEDEPVPLAPGLAPEIASPLAPFKGEKPPILQAGGAGVITIERAARLTVIPRMSSSSR